MYKLKLVLIEENTGENLYDLRSGEVLHVTPEASFIKENN